MAIKDNEPGVQTPVGMDSEGPQPQPIPDPTVAGPGPMPQQTWSFHGGGILRSPIPKGMGTDYLKKVYDGMKKAYEKTTPEYEITMVALDNEDVIALSYSAIVVCVRNKDSKKVGVAFHTLLLEATGRRPTPIVESYEGRPIEILRVASDAIDPVLLRLVNERIRQVTGSGPWFSADACVVPEEFDPADENKVHMLAQNAGYACVTELARHDLEFQDINLATVQPDRALIMNISFNRQQLIDITGMPIRSDLITNLVSKANTSVKDYSLNAGDREYPVVEVSGFVDLIYYTPFPMGGMNTWQQNIQQPGQHYDPVQRWSPRVVITNIASNLGYTPSAVLLAIASFLAINNEDCPWVQAFRPSPATLGGKELDMYDIGALNIESPLGTDRRAPVIGPTEFGQKIDTKDASFTPTDFGTVISRWLVPRLTVSIDVPFAGPTSWYSSMLSTASQDQRHQVNEYIYEAAETLTNGRFGSYFQRGMPLFTDIGNIVHLGYWIDKTGQRRDLRDFDYLAVANLIGSKEHQIIRQWSDTFVSTSIPISQRLSERKRIIQGLSNETAVFKGFANRVTFSADFLFALSRGCQDCGLDPRIGTTGAMGDLLSQRGVGSFVSVSGLAPGHYMGSPGAPGFQDRGWYRSPNNFRW